MSDLSNVRRKQDFDAVDSVALLDAAAVLSITRRRYRASSLKGEPQGPVAKAFAERFGSAKSTTSIRTVHANGVALAGIQSLNAKFEQENARRKQRLVRLEAALDSQLPDSQNASRPEANSP